MKIFSSIAILIMILIFAVNTTADENKGTIKVLAKGFENDDGKARLLLFTPENSESYPSKPEKAYKKVVVDIKNGKAVFVLKDIPYGKYAISLHHDEDGNGKVNTNWIGIPNEGLGASKDAKGNFGPPSFQEASFDLNKPEISLTINMIN